MHLCSECEREGKIEIARYKVLVEKDFSYVIKRAKKPYIFLCEKHLREKTDYQIKNAIKLRSDYKDPNYFISSTKYKLES